MWTALARQPRRHDAHTRGPATGGAHDTGALDETGGCLRALMPENTRLSGEVDTTPRALRSPKRQHQSP